MSEYVIKAMHDFQQFYVALHLLSMRTNARWILTVIACRQ